jgi:hypothetical protein
MIPVDGKELSLYLLHPETHVLIGNHSETGIAENNGHGH